mmetsp:Transcript_23382/g.33527  ORF Transcript_23382/g.33527 Transcript_23382/m.33527 type:complete len:129 (-) Transcript_23382:1040-1426(-)
MIRSRHVPPLLQRITGNGIFFAAVVTSDGELLGTSHYGKQSYQNADGSTLLTDISTDYMRLGDELQQSHMDYIEIEMSKCLIGIATAGPDCLVIAEAKPTVCEGLLKSRVMACASHIQDALIPLTDPA